MALGSCRVEGDPRDRRWLDASVGLDELAGKKVLFLFEGEALVEGGDLGVPRTEAEASAQPQDLTRVILFKRNLEKICRDGEELIEQIQITVRHEIGHHLGLSEEDLERLGLA